MWSQTFHHRHNVITSLPSLVRSWSVDRVKLTFPAFSLRFLFGTVCVINTRNCFIRCLRLHRSTTVTNCGLVFSPQMPNVLALSVLYTRNSSGTINQWGNRRHKTGPTLKISTPNSLQNRRHRDSSEMPHSSG